MPRHHGTRHATIAHPYLVPAFRAAMLRTSLTGTSATVTKSAAVQNGDLLIASIAVRSLGAEVITAPTGWTEIQQTLYNSSGSEFITYWKIAASEGASWVWTWTNSGVYAGFVVAYANIDLVRPLITVTSNPNQASSASSVATTLTPDTRGALVVTVHGTQNNRSISAAPTGMTARADATGGPATGLTELVPVQPLATGNKTVTLSSADVNGTQLLAFRPLRVGLPG
jgi:hypothetical protein